MLSAHVPREHYFDRDSYWYRRITNYTPYQHPTIPQANSTNWKNSLCQQMLINPTTGAWIGGSNTAYLTIWAGVPVYVVPAGYPRRPLRIASYNMGTVGAAPLDALLQAGVPAPLDLATGAGADNSAILYQPETDTMWELYQLSKSSPSLSYVDTAAWGGVVFGVSNFEGTFTDKFRSDGVQVGGNRWGASATSISLAGGLLEPSEVASGHIDHALPMVVAHAQFNPLLFVAPATRGDGDFRDSPGYAPEGIRIVFPPGSDFSRVRPEFMPVANCIQEFGIITMDKTGGGVALKIREGMSDEWVEVLTLYKTDALAGWRYMSSLPWHQAVIVNPALSQ
jgi:hypothetical protein